MTAPYTPLSFKTKLFQSFVRKAMKKYVGNEQAYIEKRLQGQQFNLGEKRDSKYKAPAGYQFNRGTIENLNHEILTRIDTKKLPISERKIVYVLHGGAYHSSMTDLYCGVMERYANGKYDVMAIDYKTAPKDPYPAALNDAIKGYKLLLEFGYKPENIIVAGDSAGGGLALAMALKLHDRGVDIPKTYILSSPWVDLSTEYTARQKSGDILFGWGNVLEMCANTYAGTEDTKSPYISPLYGNLDIFKDYNFYISVSVGEMLEAQGETLAAKLGISEANVFFDRLVSGVHDVITMYMLNTKECKHAWNQIHEYLDNNII